MIIVGVLVTGGEIEMEAFEKLLETFAVEALVSILMQGAEKGFVRVQSWRKQAATIETTIEGEVEEVMVKTGLWHWYEPYPIKKVRFVDHK
jgi:hypothetical protein